MQDHLAGVGAAVGVAQGCQAVLFARQGSQHHSFAADDLLEGENRAVANANAVAIDLAAGRLGREVRRVVADGGELGRVGRSVEAPVGIGQGPGQQLIAHALLAAVRPGGGRGADRYRGGGVRHDYRNIQLQGQGPIGQHPQRQHRKQHLPVLAFGPSPLPIQGGAHRQVLVFVGGAGEL